MTNKEQAAIAAALASVKYVAEHDPVAPALTDEEEAVCQGKIK